MMGPIGGPRLNSCDEPVGAGLVVEKVVDVARRVEVIVSSAERLRARLEMVLSPAVPKEKESAVPGVPNMPPLAERLVDVMKQQEYAMAILEDILERLEV